MILLFVRVMLKLAHVWFFSQRVPAKVGNNLNFVDLLRAIQDLVQHCHF